LLLKDFDKDSPVKLRKYNTINVACTEYEVVKKVAKLKLGYRLKSFEENHEGGVRNGEGG
jgi:hypothetical protein